MAVSTPRRSPRPKGGGSHNPGENAPGMRRRLRRGGAALPAAGFVVALAHHVVHRGDREGVAILVPGEDERLIAALEGGRAVDADADDDPRAAVLERRLAEGGVDA